MKSVYTALALSAFLFFGCITTHPVEPAVNLDAPFSLSVYDSTQPLSVVDEATLKGILIYWLPKMKTTIHTFPTPSARLKIEGESNDGSDTEMTVFVGQNWIGDGTGIVTLADTQAFKLWTILKKHGANPLGPATIDLKAK